MKIHKLIELWKELEEGHGLMDMTLTQNPEEILNLLQFFGRCATAKGYTCRLKEVPKETGCLSLHVTEADGKKSRIAQVKLWDNKEHTIQTRYSLRRVITDEDGVLKVVLPIGVYEAEVSCGPEYQPVWISVVIEEKKETEHMVNLVKVGHLTDNGWVAGDLHHHSVYSSPAYGGTDPVIETPAEVCRSMKALGMQFGALSDHHNVYNHRVWEQETRDFTPIWSKEISTSNGHVLQLGVDDDVIYEIPKGTARTNDALRAEFIRVCEEIRKKGGLPQVNHPFDASFSTRYNSEFLDMIEIFESMEIWNGATPFEEGTINGKAFHAWLGFLEQGKRLTATTGSDTHNIYGDDYFGMIEWINWLLGVMKEHPEIYPEVIREKAEYLQALHEQIWPFLTAWVEQSNTPSNIHNYVRTNGKNRPEEILQAIREGKVFVSNGPLVEVSVNGAMIGETAVLAEGIGAVSVSVLSQKKVANLWMYTKADEKIRLNPIEEQTPEGWYRYTVKEDTYAFGDAEWMVLYAENGANCTAVTNPIWLQ